MAKPGEANKGTRAVVLLGVAAAVGLGLAVVMSREAEAAPGTATFEGYVRDSATNQPIADALVELSGGISLYSLSNGRFKFTSLLPGAYEITCSKAGYVTLENIINLVEGTNQSDIALDSIGGGGEANLEYASKIEWTEPGSHGGMATVSISVKIKNVGQSVATAHPTGEVKTYLENNGDPYPRFLALDMGTQSIAPGQTVTFTDTISEYPDEHIILVTIQSEAGVISSEFDSVAKVVSLDMPATLFSEQEYWAQVVLRLPVKANRCYFVDMYLAGDYGLNFSTIISPAIKARLMPTGTRQDLVSYYLHGEGDYTVKGVWKSDGTKQVQYPATATYEAVLEGSGSTIQKALPAGIYKLMLKVTWYEFYTPNVFGQSGILLSQELGTVAVQENPGLPTGVYNMNGPASANYGTQVNMSAVVRNGASEPQTFTIEWSTDVFYVPRQENTVTMPANSEASSSYSFSMPALMWTQSPQVRVFCRLYEGGVLRVVQEVAVTTTLQPYGTFVCPSCGEIFNYPPPVNNEELYHQHMATH